MKRGSSLRFIEWPMPQTAAVVFSSMMALSLSRRRALFGRAQRGGGVLHRLDDVHVTGAAAEVAGDRLADLQLAGIGVALQQRVARDHHARRAETALQTVLLPEAVLDGMELAFLLEALDRHHLADRKS